MRMDESTNLAIWMTSYVSVTHQWMSSVTGETDLNAYMPVQLLSNDTDPLMCWAQHQQEFARLDCMDRQYLTMSGNSVFQ